MRRLDDDKDGVISYDELFRALNMVRWNHTDSHCFYKTYSFNHKRLMFQAKIKLYAWFNLLYI
jgi:Ca2+-binding EF-hand superfamily protein